MQELIDKLLDDAAVQRPVAYCRLVETRGSTPQKAGAMMLVYPDGSQAGTLGGGCVEADVKRRAIGVLADGQREVARFQLDDDYGWDDGLICGGRMQILIEPIRGDQSSEYFDRLREVFAAGNGASEAIVFDPANSELPAGSQYLFDSAGRLLAHRHGPLEGDDAPAVVRDKWPPIDGRSRPSATAGIAYLPTAPRSRLLIVGGGHIGQAVGNMAADVGFSVSVVDDRAEYVSRQRFPRAERLIAGDIGEVLKQIDVTPHTYCLIVTRGHNHDEQALYHLADRGARYVGMIGSRRKIKLIFDDLEAEGISPEVLAKVYAPVGIDIGSQTVPEIAISILAELIAHRNLSGQVPGRPAPLLVDSV